MFFMKKRCLMICYCSLADHKTHHTQLSNRLRRTQRF